VKESTLDSWFVALEGLDAGDGAGEAFVKLGHSPLWLCFFTRVHVKLLLETVNLVYITPTKLINIQVCKSKAGRKVTNLGGLDFTEEGNFELVLLFWRQGTKTQIHIEGPDIFCYTFVIDVLDRNNHDNL